MKPRKRINPISTRRKAQLSIYAKLKKDWFIQNPACVRCGEKASDVHHRHGRANILLIVTELWSSVCRACHDWIGDHPIEARAAGLLCPEGQWGTLPVGLREKYRP